MGIHQAIVICHISLQDRLATQHCMNLYVETKHDPRQSILGCGSCKKKHCPCQLPSCSAVDALSASALTPSF